MNRKKTRNRILAASITAVLLTALGLGIWFYIQYKNDQKTVEVIPVEQISAYYYGDQSSSSGMILSDYVQQLYPDSGKVISEVFVQEGQEVHIGDPLLQYDQTELELNVRVKQQAIVELDLDIDNAQRQLKKLQNTTPSSTPKPTSRPTTGPTHRPTPTPRPSTRPSATPTPTPVPERDVTLYSRLDADSLPYAGSGTTEDPYLFLCTDDCVMTAEFLRLLLGDGTTPAPTPTPTPTPSPLPEGGSVGDGEGTETEPESAPEAQSDTDPSPEPTEEPKLISPFAAVFEVRDGDSNYGRLLSSFRLDGTKLSGGFQFLNVLTGYNTLESIASILGASPTPNANNYNDMGYTAAELKQLITEKKQEITDLQLNKRQAQLDLDRANLQLKNSTVLSTVDGVVRTLLDLETASATGQPFLVVSGENSWYVTGAVSENALGSIQVGDLVTVNDYNTGGVYDAQIVSIADYPLDSDSNLYYYGSGNPNSSNYEFTAVIENGEGLQNGSYVDITLNLQDLEAAQALYIDTAYIREDDAGSYVMKAGVGDRLAKQYVQTGRSLYGSYLEIKSGLSREDYVTFPYGPDVKEGVRVRVQGSEEGPIAGGGGVNASPESEIDPGLADPIEGGETDGASSSSAYDDEDTEGLEPQPRDGDVTDGYSETESEGGAALD